MQTSYLEVYESFLGSVDDVELLYPIKNHKYQETESEFQERLHLTLIITFKKAIVRFKYPQTNLSRNDATEMFDYKLRPVEIEIISQLMLREYYRKKLNFLASLKHSFSDKDWKTHNQSSQMNQYRQLLKEAELEIREMENDNSYKDNDYSLKLWGDTND